MNEFKTWETLATHSGAVIVVTILCQFTKDLKFTKRIPTQIWSYILALIVIYPALYFTDQLTLNATVLTLFNAIFVSLAANGAYNGTQKMNGKHTDGQLLIDTSNNSKDVYRLDVESLDDLAKKKTITLQVKPDCDLSNSVG